MPIGTTAILALSALAIAVFAAYHFSVAVIDMLRPPEGQVRRRLLALRPNGADARMMDVDAGWIGSLAEATGGGWMSNISRVFAPVVALLDRRGVEQDRVRLAQAGLLTALEPDALIRVRAWVALLLFLALLVLGAAGGLAQGLLFAVAGGVLGARLPSFSLASMANRRRTLCIRDLPEMMDMLSLGVRAGMSFDRAVSLYTERFTGPLADEYGIALQQWQYGAFSREEALEQIDARLQVEPVTRMNSAIRQGLKLGSPMAKVLEEQSEEARIAQRMEVEKRIAEAPVKMLGPLAALILPAMLILLLGPILLSVLAGDGGFS